MNYDAAPLASRVLQPARQTATLSTTRPLLEQSQPLQPLQAHQETLQTHNFQQISPISKSDLEVLKGYISDLETKNNLNDNEKKVERLCSSTITFFEKVDKIAEDEFTSAQGWIKGVRINELINRVSHSTPNLNF